MVVDLTRSRACGPGGPSASLSSSLGPIVCGIDSAPGAADAGPVAGVLAAALGSSLVLAPMADESRSLPHGGRQVKDSQTASGDPTATLVEICRQRDAQLLVVPPRFGEAWEPPS